MNKSYRQGQILKLIRARSLRTQDELARALRTVGIRATQVTLSRDLRDLGLVKTAAGYAQPAEAAPAGRDVSTVLREFLLDVRVAQNLLVLITPPAHASSVAEALDHGLAGNHWDRRRRQHHPGDYANRQESSVVT